MSQKSRRWIFKNTLFLLGLTLLLIASWGCQTKPTKIVETPPQPWVRLVEDTKKPLKLTDATVVLDARSDFDYGLAHWSSSVHFNWKNLILDPDKPWQLVEPHTAARQLSFLGVGPQTPVMVIGNGTKGGGDEARLAWMLIYYGVQNVQTVSMDGLDVYFTHQETLAPKNVDLWTVPPKAELVISHVAFQNAMRLPLTPGKGAAVHLIDVRSKDEYFNRVSGRKKTPDLHALNIDWREFFAGDGRPQKTMRKKLQDIGIKPDDRVIVISNHGIRSSATAYALIALGYHNVENFLEGWDSL